MKSSDPLRPSFFDRPVNQVARALIGCVLLHEGVGGVIVETEGYHADDPACHAWNGPTPRNAPLYGPPGRAYVYFSYGMHNLINAVAEPEGRAAAVLIRALEPLTGIETMRRRRRRERLTELCSGPGKLTQALGVEMAHNELPLTELPFAVLDRPPGWRRPRIVTGTRIGISRGTDLPWRFCAAGNPCVSRPWPGPG